MKSRYRKIVAVSGLGALWLTGCASAPKAPRPGIADLYRDAVKAAQNYPENNGYPSLSSGSADTYLAAKNQTSELPPGTIAASPLPTLSGAITSPVKPNSQIRQMSHEQDAKKSASGAMINEIFEDTDIRQALQLIESQSKASLIVDEQVAGRVSAVLENAPLEEALEKILLPLGLLFRNKDGHYFIGTDDPKSHLFHHIAETFEYQPMHLSAMELQGLIPERSKQYLRTVEKRNSIIIEAPREKAEEILDRLRQTDRPVPQVVLEALVVVISPDSAFRYGFDWNHVLTVQGFNALNLGLSGLSLSASGSPLGVNTPFNDFAVTSAFVRLLAQEGYLTIRAAPRVMAKDGEKAEISIARESYFSTQQQTTSASAQTQLVFSQNIQKVEAGISMTITPTVRGNNITVHIEKAEVSEDLKTIDPTNNPTNNPYPLINRRKVNTTVEVPNGKTIVIGGLTQRQSVDRLSKIPYLGDIPWMGRLFQTIEKQEFEAEIVIFISPKIVCEPCQVAVPNAFDGITPPTEIDIPPSPTPLLPAFSHPANGAPRLTGNVVKVGSSVSSESKQQ